MIKKSHKYMVSAVFGLAGAGAIFYFLNPSISFIFGEKAPVMKAVSEEKVVYVKDRGIGMAEYKKDCENRGGEFLECGNACAAGANDCADNCAYVCVLKEVRRNGDMPEKPEEFKAETLALTSSADPDIEGIATREWDGLLYVHTLTAKLPDNDGGQAYFGWLSDGKATVKTGELKTSGGGRALTFTSDNNYLGYSRVMISREENEEADKPGEIILEGEFEK